MVNMALLKSHLETHASSRIGWLRASVMGANDGIVSTASLIVGVAASDASKMSIVIAGSAALIAGAMSMAAGEYVSVSAQADTEKADLARESDELRDKPDAELEELTRIYEARGVDRPTSVKVAEQMMAHDSLAAHARDELGLSSATAAQPLQAALASALTFTTGALAPLAAVLFVSTTILVPVVALISLICLALLGGLGAKIGKAPLLPSIARVTFWGAMAMAVTAAVGWAFGAFVA